MTLRELEKDAAFMGRRWLRELLFEDWGMKLLALAITLMTQPQLLMIDELSLGLAPVVVAEMLEVVARLRDEGVGIVVVEQQVDLALDVADRAYFLERGEVRFAGPAVDLRGRTDLLRAVFLAGAGTVGT